MSVMCSVCERKGAHLQSCRKSCAPSFLRSSRQGGDGDVRERRQHQVQARERQGVPEQVGEGGGESSGSWHGRTDWQTGNRRGAAVIAAGQEHHEKMTGFWLGQEAKPKVWLAFEANQRRKSRSSKPSRCHPHQTPRSVQVAEGDLLLAAGGVAQ